MKTCRRLLLAVVVVAVQLPGFDGSDGSRMAPPLRGAQRAAGLEQQSRPDSAPFWISVPVGLAVAATTLPLSPVYSILTLALSQTPQSRLVMGRVGAIARTRLGFAPKSNGQREVTVSEYARALNARLDAIVDDLGEVPAFVVVDSKLKPLKISVGESAGSNMTFAYLDFDDAEALIKGFRTPTGDAVTDVKVMRCDAALPCRGGPGHTWIPRPTPAAAQP